MALAADLLAEPDATVSSVAHRVGYTDGLALRVAFKRTRESAQASTGSG